MNKTTQQLAQQLLNLLNNQTIAKRSANGNSVGIYNGNILLGNIALSTSKSLRKNTSAIR